MNFKEESFNRLQEVMIEAGELKEKVPYTEIVNNTYAEKAIKEYMNDSDF